MREQIPSRVVAIINPGAGKGETRELADNLTQRFKSAGLTAEIILLGNGPKIIEAAHRAVQQKPLAIVAGGGDGTINAVASAVVETRIPLGVLPLGTLNHFAKDLHIPLDLEEAMGNIIAGHVVNIDVGEVNDRIILNNSSLGLYPSVVRLRDQQQERLGRGKWPAFVWAALTVLRRYPFLNVRLSIDGNELTRRTPFVFIGNNQYEVESFNIGSRGCLDAGQLGLYMPHATGRWGLLRLGLHALSGRLGRAKDFDALCAKEIWIETHRKRLHVAIDGEVMIMSTPLRYRVRPGSLRVIVPETHESNGKKEGERAHARPSL